MANVSLRKVTEKDVPMIYRWRNDPRVRMMMFNEKPISMKEHEEFWERELATGKNFSFIVESDGLPVGVARLEQKEEGKKERHEVDIFVGSEYWGKGIGQKALGKLMEFARERKLKNIFARVKPSNAPSRKIFEKNGFKLEHLYYVWVS